jgi:nicotinamide mononucleotide transporter
MDGLIAAAAPLLASAFTVAFTLWGSPVTWLEIVAAVLGICMVLCNLRVNPAGWPLAIISSLLYALLFAESKLYGEAALQLFFIVISAWGWWQWLRGTGSDGHALAVRWLSTGGRGVALVSTLLAWPLLGLLLDRLTDSDVPYLDALPTVASVTAQILLARKLIENWPLWLAVNLFSMALFAYKALWLTVVLYGVFALLSVAGWRAWQRRVHV